MASLSKMPADGGLRSPRGIPGARRQWRQDAEDDVEQLDEMTATTPGFGPAPPLPAERWIPSGNPSIWPFDPSEGRQLFELFREVVAADGFREVVAAVGMDITAEDLLLCVVAEREELLRERIASSEHGLRYRRTLRVACRRAGARAREASSRRTRAGSTTASASRGSPERPGGDDRPRRRGDTNPALTGRRPGGAW